MNVFDEFLPSGQTAVCTVGSLGWCEIGSGALGAVSGYNGHPGTVRVLTSGASGETDALALNNNNTGPTWAFSLGSTAQLSTWEVRFTIQTDDWGPSVANGAYEDGFKDSLVYRSGNSIAIRYDPTARTCGTGTNSTTTWMLEVFNGGTSSCVSTGVSVAAATWYTVDLKSPAPGTVTAQVAINGGAFSSAVTVSSGVPTAAVSPVFLVLSEAGFRTGEIIDWWQMIMTGLTR